MRACTLAAAVVLSAGCYTPRYTVRSVAASELAEHRSGGRDRELLLASEDGSSVRLGPASIVRFQRKDGSFTSPYRARDIRVSQHGVHGTRVRAALSTARRARVVGLEPELRSLLQETAPPWTFTGEPGGQIASLPAADEELISWIQRFLRAAATRQDGASPGDRWTAESLGRWSFDLPQVGGWTEEIDGSMLIDALSAGVEVRDGIRWSDLSRVEVANVSGGKSLLVTTGVTTANVAIGAFLVAAAAMGAATSLRWGEAGPDFSAAGRGASRGAQTASLFVPAASGPKPPLGGEQDDKFWQDGLSPPPADATAVLFSSGPLRRSIVRPVLTLDSGTDALRRDALHSSLVATARIGEAYELGGGVRHLWIPSTVTTGAGQSLGGFFRLGMVFDLDAPRRFQVPLSFDVGAGQEVAVELKVNLGLRVRLNRSVHVGIYPFSPRYARYSSGFASGLRAWSFPTTIELGWTP